jgi:hypothetical protein
MGTFVLDGFDQAMALGHHWCGDEHVLLALLAQESFLGLTHDSVRAAVVARVERAGLPPRDPSWGRCRSAPSFHDAHGRATGFALGTGTTTIGPEQAWAALLWDPTGLASTLAGLGGLTRREMLDAVGPLGRLVPEAPSTNALCGAAEREAVALGHGPAGAEHLVLALVAGAPDDAAGRLLRDAGLDHDALAARLVHLYDDPDAPPPPPGPRRANAVGEAFGAAEGLAATLGDGVVRSTDGLLAYLWQEDGHQAETAALQGSSVSVLVAALRAAGVRIPTVAIPESDRLPWGTPIQVPEDRAEEIVAVVLARYPALVPWRIVTREEGWVMAKTPVDLQSIVDEVLARGQTYVPPPAVGRLPRRKNDA